MLTFLGPGTGRLPENHLSIHSEQGTCSYEHSQHLAQQKCCFRLLVLSMSADQTLPQEAKFTETPRCFITTARYPYGVALKWICDLLGWARARLWHPLPPFGTRYALNPTAPFLGPEQPSRLSDLARSGASRSNLCFHPKRCQGEGTNATHKSNVPHCPQCIGRDAQASGPTTPPHRLCSSADISLRFLIPHLDTTGQCKKSLDART